MSMHTRARRRLVTGIAAGAATLVPAAAYAGSTDGTLPNGASISVSVDAPLTGDSFLVPEGATTVDVPLSGQASIGLGTPQTTWIYVIDLSGSTASPTCDGSTILACEQDAIIGLDAEVAAGGGAIASGLAAFGSSGAAADVGPGAGQQDLTTPGSADLATVVGSTDSDGGIGQFTAKNVGGASTNFAAGLEAADGIAAGAGSGPINVVFLSDGVSNDTTSGGFAAALSSLAAKATIYPFAVGASSSCAGGSAGTLDDIAAASGTQCYPVPDPADLPDVVKNVTQTTLTSVTVTLDGAPVPATVVPALPEDGPAMVDWTAPGDDLAPGEHEVCATAKGIGPADDPSSETTVTRCETFAVYAFALTPPHAVNELGVDDQHLVTAQLSGPAGSLAGWPVDFTVPDGPNAGATGTCAPAACTTDATGTVTWTYSVPVAPSSLGTDTIRAAITVDGLDTARQVTKLWQDTTPPVASCVQGPNPGGSIPQSPGGGSAQNPDGFYHLVATDDVWGTDVDLHVKDLGTGHVFGPFDPGTDIKWVEAGKGWSQKPGQGAVEWFLKGTGDAELTATDGSGNVSAPVVCRVPQPPK